MLFRLHGSKGEGEKQSPIGMCWFGHRASHSGVRLPVAMTSPVPAGTPCRHASTGLLQNVIIYEVLLCPNLT